MKLRRWIRIGLAACLVVTCLLTWAYFKNRPAAPVSSPTIKKTDPPLPSTPAQLPTPAEPKALTHAQSEIRKEERLLALYATPISIFGKVVDQDGNPIPAATVTIGIADRPLETGTSYTETTDGDGLFSLNNVRGIAFSATAAKEGYYSYEQSTRHRNVVAPSRNDVSQPSKSDPVLLVLRKKKMPEPLIVGGGGQIDIPRSGLPINVDLASGRRASKGSLQISSRVGDASKSPFDWFYELSIPSGGIMKRSDQFEFEAPSVGYESSVEIGMTKTDASWSPGGQKEYFAKLPDGKYARLSIRFYPSEDRNFVVIESYMNPSAGNRNLEYDPNVAIGP